jgi:hypothetical protein
VHPQADQASEHEGEGQVKNYKLIVDFHAENDLDAKAQTQVALTAFDDGYGAARLTEDGRVVIDRDPPSRCPRCEGYEATYHTFEGECSERVK